MRQLLFDNLFLKLIALILGIATFVVVRGEAEMTDTHELEVVVELQEGMVFRTQPTSSVKVTLTGRWDVIKDLENKGLPPIRLMPPAGSGTRIVTLTPGMIALPDGVEVEHFEPSTIVLDLDSTQVRQVPVNVSMSLEELPQGVTVERVEADPSQVEIVGPASLVDDVQYAVVDPIDITTLNTTGSHLEGSFTVERVAKIDHPVVNVSDPTPLRVTVHLTRDDEARAVSDVPIFVLNFGTYELTPAQTSLTLTGSEAALAALDVDTLLITVDANAESISPDSATTITLQASHVLNLPPGVSVDATRLPTVVIAPQAPMTPTRQFGFDTSERPPGPP